jgi:hypothetical protein
MAIHGMVLASFVASDFKELHKKIELKIIKDIYIRGFSK